MVTKLINHLEDACMDEIVGTAFPAEAHEEEKLQHESTPLDAVHGKEDLGSAEDLQALEHEMLEEVPLPGIPSNEAERKRRWFEQIYE